MKKLFLLLLLSGWYATSSFAQQNTEYLHEYFAKYTNPDFPNLKEITVKDIQTDDRGKHITIVLSDNFIAQPLTPLIVDKIYTEVKLLQPAPYNSYNLTIC